LFLRRYYGPWQAVLGGALFVLVPIHVWFAAHIDPGMPGIACVLGAFLCYFAWLDSGLWKFGFAALGLMMLSVLFEWSPYLAAVPLFVHAAYVGRERRGRFLTWAVLLPAALLLPLLMHGIVVLTTGHLREMQESFLLRSGGPTLSSTLSGLATSAYEMFGAPLLLALFAWLVLFLRRAVLRQVRRRELVPFAFAFAVISYTVVLRNGVLVHLYRMLYGGVLSAFAGVEVVEAVGAAMARLGRSVYAQKVAAAAATVALLAGTLPYSWHALLISRKLGGVPLASSFDPGMHPRAFIQRVLSLTSPTDLIYDHVSFVIRKDLFFDLDRNLLPVPSIRWMTLRPPQERSHAVLMLIEPLRNPQEQAQLLELCRRHPVFRIYEYTLVDLRQTYPPTNDPQQKQQREHRERLRPPAARGFWTRYFEGPYSYPQLEPVPI
jgi:hypothetical protein